MWLDSDSIKYGSETRVLVISVQSTEHFEEAIRTYMAEAGAKRGKKVEPKINNFARKTDNCSN